MGQWILEGEGGDNYTVTISQGSAETNSEAGYFMMIESYYPGADVMGPIGGALIIDGTNAVYSVDSSEGILNTEMDMVLDGDQLTFTWTGGDFIFNIRTLGESRIFTRMNEYLK
ncbi:MAG: hypothetical protein JJE29_05285 [Peptostreptococcaceae bacterium]|nr:hypothetical protein [Peptostreptococcaceae bacterium]